MRPSQHTPFRLSAVTPSPLPASILQPLSFRPKRRRLGGSPLLSSRPERPAFSCARFLSAGRAVEGSRLDCANPTCGPFGTTSECRLLHFDFVGASLLGAPFATRKNRQRPARRQLLRHIRKENSRPLRPLLRGVVIRDIPQGPPGSRASRTRAAREPLCSGCARGSPPLRWRSRAVQTER